jgi:hypothetical protein
MKNVNTFNEFLNETVIKIPVGQDRKNNVRVNGIGNKLYLENFETNLDPTETKKFLSFIKEKYAHLITNITHHVGDLVVTFSLYINKEIADNIAGILNDIFTARAESNMEDSEEKPIKEPEGMLDGDTANKSN